MSHPAPALPMKGALALKVFIFFAFAYILSYAFRSVNAVIAPELMADLKISNAQLGLLSAAYFIGSRKGVRSPFIGKKEIHPQMK
jgi:sugar phosphate permease